MSEDSIISHYKPAKLVLIAAALAGCLLLGGRQGWFAAASMTEPARQTETRPEVAFPHAAKDQPGETAEIQVIKITRFGFEPRELERSHKAFVLAIHNSSRKPDLALQLQRVQGNNNKLHEVRMGRGKRKWQLPLTLPPGDYLLTEASRPDWRCQIKLTN